MKILRFIALLPLLLLASCAKDSKPKKSPTNAPPERKTLSERMNEKNSYKQDPNGNWVPQSDRRSPYESQGQAYDAKRDYKKQAYQTGDYSKKSWWGNKDYGRKSYGGNTDGSQFQKSSRLQGKTAHETGSNAKIPDNYQTNNYATSAYGTQAAHQGSNSQIQKKANKEFDWQEQRSLSVEQSKGILGH